MVQIPDPDAQEHGEAFVLEALEYVNFLIDAIGDGVRAEHNEIAERYELIRQILIAGPQQE